MYFSFNTFNVNYTYCPILFDLSLCLFVCMFVCLFVCYNLLRRSVRLFDCLSRVHMPYCLILLSIHDLKYHVRANTV